MKRVSIWVLKAYKSWVSVWLPPACRFYPTCSEYCMEAIQKYGFRKGFYLGMKRLTRCHPWNKGGYDPVP